MINSQMKVVVIGYGSIGKRHVNNLISLGIRDITLCRIDALGNQLNLNEIVLKEDIVKINPDFVIVSNPTSLHYQTLKFLLQHQLNNSMKLRNQIFSVYFLLVYRYVNNPWH